MVPRRRQNPHGFPFSMRVCEPTGSYALIESASLFRTSLTPKLTLAPQERREAMGRLGYIVLRFAPHSA